MMVSGSIPARAGEPKVTMNAVAHKGVYPRACGGTLASWVGWSPLRGLSPRVRGNPDLAKNLVERGEGLSPRVRGNPDLAKNLVERGEGLSPRVRGNH